MSELKLRKALVLVLSLLCFAEARAAGTYVKLDYPASTASNELQVAVTYLLWIADGVKTLRGIIVHQHGAGTTASITFPPYRAGVLRRPTTRSFWPRHSWAI